MPRNRRLGGDAEDAAADYVCGLGYILITRNYHVRGAEIDMVALDGETLVFFEVRQRQKGGWALPEETVTLSKQKRLWQAAEQYLSDVLGKEAIVRFDVIAIEGDAMRHHKDAFRPA